MPIPSVFFGVVSLLVTVSWAQMTIPPRELGFIYKEGRPCATVKLAAYLDLTCPDSQEAFPTLKEVADHFGPFDLQLKVHLFSLPYHRNSHTISKGAQVLSQFKSPKNATVFDWFTAIYGNMEKFVPSATTDKTDTQVLDMLASLATTVSGISADQFKTQVADSAIDSATRLDWKYGCTRGVYGTPMFTVNDVFVNAQATWTVEQWINLIKSLLVTGKQKELVFAGC